MSRATYNRIELGQRDITPEDLSAVLLALGVKGDDRERLLALAREKSSLSWLETGNGLPQQIKSFVAYESEATKIVHLAMILVPGLMQTPEYARAAVASGGATVADPDALIATRLGRQVILTRTQPPKYHLMLDESVLFRPLGGSSVLLDQLRHIQKIGERPHITTQIIPRGIGGHHGCDGPYTTLEFERRSPVVYIEAKRSGIFLEDPDDVGPFLAANDELREQALSPDESSTFIADVINDMERSP
jgi:hypothetical protein